MSDPKKIRVYIADDFAIMRRVIHLLIERTPDMVVVGEAPVLKEALKEVQSLQPDVILMNDYLPPTTSAMAAKLFRELHITAAILIISMYVETHLIQQSFASGSNGFMHKDEMGELLTDAIRQVHNKQRYLSPKAKEALTDHQE